MSRTWLALTLAALGEFDEGVSHGRAGLRIAEGLDDPFSVALVSWGLASLYRARGELEPALQLGERGLALSRGWTLPFFGPLLTVLLASIHALAGRAVEAAELLAVGSRERSEQEQRQQRLLTATSLAGEVLLLAGRVDDAAAVAMAVVNGARARGLLGTEAEALWLHGEVAARREPPAVDDSEHHYRDAVTLAIDLGMRPLQAHCHLGLGKLYRRTGKREQAREHLITATTLYREMDMRFWLEQAEAELGRLA